MLADAEANGGALIESLVPQGPAERAGLKPKDVITSVDGKAVKNREETTTIVRQHPPGESVKLYRETG